MPTPYRMQFEAQPGRERSVLRGRSRIAKYESQRFGVQQRGLHHRIASPTLLPLSPHFCTLHSPFHTSFLRLFLFRMGGLRVSAPMAFLGIQSNMYRPLAGPHPFPYISYRLFSVRPYTFSLGHTSYAWSHSIFHWTMIPPHTLFSVFERPSVPHCRHDTRKGTRMRFNAVRDPFS